MENRAYILLIVLLSFISCHSMKTKQAATAKKNPNSLSIKLVNGNWFNGASFEKKTAWVNEGILSFKKANIENDTIIDLDERYVIPPFCEAHNHNLESSYKLNERIDAYLNNGVFYVKLLSSIKKRIDPLTVNVLLFIIRADNF